MLIPNQVCELPEFPTVTLIDGHVHRTSNKVIFRRELENGDLECEKSGEASRFIIPKGYVMRIELPQYDNPRLFLRAPIDSVPDTEGYGYYWRVRRFIIACRHHGCGLCPASGTVGARLDHGSRC
jgi:hypothetical protein